MTECICPEGAVHAWCPAHGQPDDGYPGQPETCLCDLTTGCGESHDAGCWACRNADCYEPCPVFGFMCDPECGDPENPCCTPEQREMTRQLRATDRPLIGSQPQTQQ